MTKPARTPEAIAQELARMKARLEGGAPASEPAKPRGMGFFEAILHHAGEPVAVLQDGLHLFVNPPYESLVGQPREALVGRPFADLLADPDRSAFERTLGQLRSGSEDAELPLRLATDPAEAPERRWRLQRFQQGGTTYLRVEPVRARAHAPSGPFSSLESDEHALALTLPNTRLAAVSPALCDLLGIPGPTLTRMAWSDLVPAEHLARLDLALGKGRRTGHAACDVSLRTGDGSWREVRLEVMPWLGRTTQGDGALVLVQPPTAAASGEGEATPDVGYQQVFQTMAEAYALHELITDPEGRPLDYRFLEVNPAWEAFTGLSAEQVVGRTVLEVLPGTEPYWIERFGQVALTGESTSFEQYSSAVGKHFRVMAQSPRKGLFSVLAVDVTEELRREQRLALLSRAVDQSPATIVITNPQGEIEYANPKFETLTGYTVQEALGQNPRILKSGLQGTEVYEDLWQTLMRGESWRGELCNRRKDGTLFWERALISPMLEAGRVTHFLAVKEDITRERALEETRQRLLTALEQIEDAVAVTAPDGRVITANRAMRTLVGCSCEACPSDPDPQACKVKHLLEGAARDARTALAAAAPGAPKVWRGLLPWQDSQGQARTLSATLQQMEGSAQEPGDLFMVLRDVTRERELERSLRQHEKLDALGKLAGGIAHDFNNVLATILAAAELLEWQLPENSPGREKIEAIRLAGRRAQELNRRILSFARTPETKQIPFDLSTVAKEVAGLLKATLPEGIELKASLASSIWCQGDPNQLLQVVMNLCVNAFQAMKGTGGSLTLRLTEVNLQEGLPNGLKPGRHAVLEVEDEGEGMSPETLSRVFDPFYTTKAEGEGTGLGLFVAHGIVAAHGGQLRLESTLGEGTRAYVCLPCAEPEQVPLAAPQETEPTGEEHLLLLGGEALWSALTCEGLRQYGYRVTPCQDPFDALERLRTLDASVEAVIVGQGLRGMTGGSFLKRVRREHPAMPLLALTETNLTGQNDLVESEAADEILLLPATPKDLARVARRLLDARRAEAQSRTAKEEPSAGPDSSLPLVLLAEDSSVTRTLLRTWLQKSGYAVLEARDGQEAWERFQERGSEAFAAVLSDLVMPRMDGIQLISRIRELDPSLPTLILSSMEDAESLKAALQVQVSEYLTKPFTSKALMDALGRLLQDQGTRRTARRNQETAQAVRRAQQSLVPVPEADLPIFSVSQTLTDAGGDVLRCLRREDGSILFVLADVAGHSVISSYAVAAFLGMLSTFAREAGDLRDLALRLNRSIQEGPFQEVPVCALLGRWEPSRGRLHLLNAGIPHGLLAQARGGRSRMVAVNGTPLGIFEEPMVDERVLWLEAGDRLLFATDGVFEVRGEDETFFADRSLARWSELRGASIPDALGQFVESARAFGKGQLADDLLVMAFEQPEPDPSESLRLWLPSKTSALDRACQRLKEHLAQHETALPLSPSRRFDLILAARELLTNALFHGNAERPEAEIHLRCAVDPRTHRLELLVCDEGAGFDLARHRGPEDPLSERGRGIPFIRAIGGELRVEAGEVCMSIPLEG